MRKRKRGQGWEASDIQKKAMFYLLLLFCLSCSKKTEDDGARSNQVDEYEFQDAGTLTDWKCFDAGTDKICVPNEWKRVENQTFKFFSYLSKAVDPNRFFVVVKYDTAEVELDLIRYLKEVVTQIKADTHEISKEGSFRYLTFEESPPRYYGEFITEIEGQQYYTFSMYTIRFGSLFDFSLKAQANEKDIAYADFQNVLFNYKVGEHYLFERDDRILSIDLIDPNTF